MKYAQTTLLKTTHLIFALAGVTLLSLFVSSCINQRCYENADCKTGQICNTATGECKTECETDADCSPGFECVEFSCELQSQGDEDKEQEIELFCPDDMAKIKNAFCMDIYEAARPDATDSNAGTDETRAVSKLGVLPWRVSSNQAAEQACKESGKRLCYPNEWNLVCRGSKDTNYCYGDEYQTDTCNGIDSFGRSSLHLTPTGAFQKCYSDYGVYDINGNLWEHTANGSDMQVRGGAYNCMDSATLHNCDYIPGDWTPSALGFRCCSDLKETNSDGDYDQTHQTDGDRETEGGCLDGDWVDGDLVDKDSTEGDLDKSDTDIAEKDADKDIDIEKDRDIESEQDTEKDIEQDIEHSACPSDMSIVGNFCIDKYEASHSDASADSQGSSSTPASKPDVMPWWPIELDSAKSACILAGKRLCKTDEWISSCQGVDGYVYSYGNTYSADTCNGIDAFCKCSSTACESVVDCPYPHCFNQQSSAGGGPCGSYYHVTKTGAFKDCTNSYGVFDINGNLWEMVDGNDGLDHFRGGAYNCGDSERLHRCANIITFKPPARGFRCCKDKD